MFHSHSPGEVFGYSSPSYGRLFPRELFVFYYYEKISSEILIQKLGILNLHVPCQPLDRHQCTAEGPVLIESAPTYSPTYLILPRYGTTAF